MTLLRTLLLALALGFGITALAGSPAPNAAFPGAKGNYGGLIQTADENPLTAGTLTFSLVNSGRFSAKLVWRGEKYSFKGKFDRDTADYAATFIPKDDTGSADTLSVSATLDPAARTITGTLEELQATVSTLTADFTLSGARASAGAGNAFKGQINTAFIDPPAQALTAAAEGPDTSQPIPGDGFSIVRFGKNKSRSGRFVGRLPDDEPYSAGSPLRGTDYTVLSSLYKKGKTTGGQVLGNASAADFDGVVSNLRWGKKQNAEPDYYPGGIRAGIFVRGKKYPKIRLGQNVPLGPSGAISAKITLRDGNLGRDANDDPVKIKADIRITPFKVKVLGENPQQLKVKIKATKASFKGTFIHPVSGESTKFNGTFQQNVGPTPGSGRGSFKGTLSPNDTTGRRESGSVRITIQ